MNKFCYKIFQLILLFTFMLNGVFCLAQDTATENNLRTKFLNNKTIIMAINIRSFNSNDTNEDGVIQEKFGEKRGTFLNAINRLDEIKKLGVNTLHLLPIMEVGKTHALGTAGSLYSPSSFNKLNPDFYDKTSKLSLEEQAKKFIEEAHKRNIDIIVDVPACASYDLFLKNPELFIKDQNGEPISPLDWTDVRLLDGGNEEQVNEKVLELYKSYVDYVISLGADGIRADVAHSKPALFWEILINYSKEKNPNLLWLAESSDSWHDGISKTVVYTPYNKLLDAGFDGYYGSFFNLKNLKEQKNLNKQFNYTFKDLKKYNEPKAVIGAFSTHDEISPVLIHGSQFSEMIMWLNATLPLNSYFVDGFQSGDTYEYKLANQTMPETNTDNSTFYVHNGQIDIFNYSRKPDGKNKQLTNEFLLSNDVKNSFIKILNNGQFKTLNPRNKHLFAYETNSDTQKILTIGNLDFNNEQKLSMNINWNNLKKTTIYPIKITTLPKQKRNNIKLNLKPGEIVVLMVK